MTKRPIITVLALTTAILASTDVTETVPAMTTANSQQTTFTVRPWDLRHVVTATFPFDQTMTLATKLPLLLLCQFKQQLRVGI
jgi:hypothetical protein